MHYLAIGTEHQKAHTNVMRTTIKLDDEAEQIVRLYADSRDISVSKAISELVVQAVHPKMRIKYVDGIPVFDIPQGRTITDEEVRAAIAEEY
jgi:predicted transcriptional regulator